MSEAVAESSFELSRRNRVTRPDDMSSYEAGRPLDQVMLDSYRKLYGG